MNFSNFNSSISNIGVPPELSEPVVNEACLETARQMYDSYFLDSLFKTRVFLAIAIIVIAIFYFRIRYLQKRREQLEEIVRKETLK